MRQIIIHWLLLMSVATAEPDFRQKRHFSFFKNWIRSSFLGSNQQETDRSPYPGTDNVYKLYRIPGFSDILVQAVPVGPVIKETLINKPRELLQIEPFETYIGTKSPKGTLVALQNVNNLLSTGILSDHTNLIEETIVPMISGVSFDPQEVVKPIPVVSEIIQPIQTEVMVKPNEEQVKLMGTYNTRYSYKQVDAHVPAAAVSTPNLEVIVDQEFDRMSLIPPCIDQRIEEVVSLGTSPHRLPSIKKVMPIELYPLNALNRLSPSIFDDHELKKSASQNTTLNLTPAPLINHKPNETSTIEHLHSIENDSKKNTNQKDESLKPTSAPLAHPEADGPLKITLFQYHEYYAKEDTAQKDVPLNSTSMSLTLPESNDPLQIEQQHSENDLNVNATEKAALLNPTPVPLAHPGLKEPLQIELNSSIDCNKNLEQKNVTLNPSQVPFTNVNVPVDVTNGEIDITQTLGPIPPEYISAIMSRLANKSRTHHKSVQTNNPDTVIIEIKDTKDELQKSDAAIMKNDKEHEIESTNNDELSLVKPDGHNVSDANARPLVKNASDIPKNTESKNEHSVTNGDKKGTEQIPEKGTLSYYIYTHERNATKQKPFSKVEADEPKTNHQNPDNIRYVYIQPDYNRYELTSAKNSKDMAQNTDSVLPDVHKKTSQNDTNAVTKVKERSRLMTNAYTNPPLSNQYVYVPPKISTDAASSNTIEYETVTQQLFTNEVTSTPKSNTESGSTQSIKDFISAWKETGQNPFENAFALGNSNYVYRQSRPDGSYINVKGNKAGVSVSVNETPSKGRGDIPGE